MREDLLEEAKLYLDRLAIGPWPDAGRAAGWIIRDLAAEVRELRGELERVYELRDELRAEVRELRAMVVWCVKHEVSCDHNEVYVRIPNDGYETTLHDGTDTDILRAVRETRTR